MREALQPIDGQRKTFIGTFIRFGTKSSYKGPPLKTILLQDIYCNINNEIKTNHLWFVCRKTFDKVNLQEGDVIQFDARVQEYYKGYRGGHRYDDEYNDSYNEHPIEKDYKLSHPTNVKLIKRVPLLIKSNDKDVVSIPTTIGQPKITAVSEKGYGKSDYMNRIHQRLLNEFNSKEENER